MTGRKKNLNANKKRHHSERFRGANLVVERMTNAKAGHIGFHVGRGRSSSELS